MTPRRTTTTLTPPDLYQYGLNNPVSFSDPMGLEHDTQGALWNAVNDPPPVTSTLKEDAEAIGAWPPPCFRPGIFMQRYQSVANETLDPSNSLGWRVGAGGYSLMIGPLAGFEEMGRGILNYPCDLYEYNQAFEKVEARYQELLAAGYDPLEAHDLLEEEGYEAELLIKGPGVAMLPLGSGRGLSSIGFTDDAVASAFRGMRSGGGHAIERPGRWVTL